MGRLNRSDPPTDSEKDRNKVRKEVRKEDGATPAANLLLGTFVLAVVFGMAVTHIWPTGSAVTNIPYSEFRTRLAEGQVESALVGEGVITGQLRTTDGVRPFRTHPVAPALAEQLGEAGVEYDGQRPAGLVSRALLALFPVLLFLGLWFFLMRGAVGGGGPGAMMKATRSRAKVYVESDTRTRFQDVAGIEEAKSELEEVVGFLRDPARFARLGARMPRGMLLVGPPGTGKTLLARAVAGEAGVPFFSISGSEFVELFVGVGAARVRDLFEQARKQSPCIIFIDELDALGRARSSGANFGGHDEKEQTLNQLLVELDGFDGSTGIVVLAATNRPEVLDAALLRAGRFDRRVTVGRPDRAGRLAILDVHASDISLEKDLTLDTVAALTPGFSGADLANLVNEAAIVATRRDAHSVGLADFNAAIERLMTGLEQRSRRMELREREIVAVHEMGHALVATALPDCDPVTKISIIPRDMGALGFTLQRPAGERQIETRQELEQRIAVLMGGRAAEHLVFGHLSTGAADDLARATQIAREMVMRFAMVPELGNLSFSDMHAHHLGQPSNGGATSFSEATASAIDQALRVILDEARSRADAILAANRSLLDRSATRLLDQETLDEKAINELFGDLATEAVSTRLPAERTASA